MKKRIVSILFTMITSGLFGQSFITEITFDDFLGNIDTVQIGYDESATIDLDSNFGEFDISGDPSFRNKVQLAQIDILQFDCEDNDVKLEDIVTYQSEIDILPKECLEFIPNSAIGGFIPVSTVLIPNNRIPLLMKWDKFEFESECLKQSLVTDVRVDYWWDPTCENIFLGEKSMIEITAILIDKPIGDQIVNQFDDTLSLVYIALIHDNGLTNSKLTKIKHSIKPNPSFGEISIITDQVINKIEVYDLSGNLLNLNINDGKIKLNKNGLQIIKTTYKDGNVIIDKIVNYVR